MTISETGIKAIIVCDFLFSSLFPANCFECESFYGCVYDPDWVCDGYEHCYNGEDEINCTGKIEVVYCQKYIINMSIKFFITLLLKIRSEFDFTKKYMIQFCQFNTYLKINRL